MTVNTLEVLAASEYTPVVIKSSDDLLVAVDTLSNLNLILDNVIMEREKVTKPLNEALKAERARWKPIEDKLGAAIEQDRGAISRWQQSVLDTAKKNEQEVSKRLTSGDISLEEASASVAVMVGSQKVSSAMGSVSFRTDKVVEVIDIKKVPREYLEINLARVKEVLKSGKKVAGCRLVEVQTVINKR